MPISFSHEPTEARRERFEDDSEHLGDFIRERKGEILAAWERGVRQMPVAQQLDRPELFDHIPDVLERISDLADELHRSGNATLPRDVSELHAITRLGEGFDLAQVVVEFGILRDCIMRSWEAIASSPDHVAEMRLLNRAIDEAVGASIERYTRARDRTLQSLDRIANAALESRSLDEFLRRLLEVLVQSTASVDTATILLREGDVFRVRASVGLEEEVEQSVTVGWNQGFVGEVATTRRPVEIRDATTDTTIQRQALRSLRGIYGIPLSDGGSVIAVAHMGSRTTAEFSTQDKRLFAAMANRATAAIFQHVLREQAERATKELGQREAELRALADNIQQLAWMVDNRGNHYWSNRRWLEYTGTSLADAGGDFSRFHHPDYADSVKAKWDHAVATGQAWEDTFPLRGKDGRYRWFLSRATPTRDAAGNVVRWVGTNTDITDQRFLDEATKVLNASLDYEQTLQEVARQAVPAFADWCLVDIVDESGDVRRVAIVHGDPDKVKLAREWTASHPPSREATGGVPNVIKTGQPELATTATDELLARIAGDDEMLRNLRMLQPQSYVIAPIVARGRTLGAITWVSSTPGHHYTTSDRDLASELGRRAGTAIDNARLYAESQKALQSREEAVRSRDEVLAIVSHDLRNPLATVELCSSNLMLDHGSVPRTRKQLEILRRATERMESLIDDLLDMATIQAKGLSLNVAPEHADLLVNRIVEAHEPLAAERGISILREYELDGTMLWCDRDRVEQVFQNLLGNALKYCRAGDVVFVRGSEAGDHVVFSVADTGPGIAPDELGHLFEPYWVAKRHGTKKGTGLGLYIAKGIVEAHGGTLTVESRPGDGAQFTFALPIRPAHDR